MHHGSGWIGGLAGVVVVAGAVLARNPTPPLPAAAQAAAPSPVVMHPRPLFAPACSAVYRTDGCETARRATWKA